MAEVVLSIVAGFHVPVMLLVDVVGRIGASAPEQIGAIAVNVGTMVGLTVIVKAAVVAHWPPFGVNV